MSEPSPEMRGQIEEALDAFAAELKKTEPGLDGLEAEAASAERIAEAESSVLASSTMRNSKS